MTRTFSLLAVEPLSNVAVTLFAEWFSGLDPITYDALARHVVLRPGNSLEKVGERHGCTREWVRQKEIAGKRDVLATLRALDSEWVDRLFASLTNVKLVSLSFLAGLFGGREHGTATAFVIVSHLEWRATPQSQGWFCSDSDWVDSQIAELSSNGPLEAAEWEALVASSALPLELIEESEIPNVGQWVPYLGSRCQRSSKTRPVALLEN